jgi:NADH-quinone oxidoreductase subunit N
MSATDLLLFSPYLVVGLGAIAVLLAGILPVPGRQRLAFRLTLLLLSVVFVLTLGLWGQSGSVMDGDLRIDTLTLAFNALSSVGAFAVLVLARDYSGIRDEVGEAFCALVLFTLLGMFILAASTDLLASFLGLELVAVPLFGLIAWEPGRRGAIEGGLKYAVLSGLAAAFWLYGLALIYAGAGTLDLDAIAKGLSHAHSLPVLTVAGFIVLLVGIGFELALVPFHMWVADVYEGAPLPVTALLGTVTKVALLLFLVRLVSGVPPVVLETLTQLLAVLGVLGMLVGNLLALRQENLMRLLGYSTIAHFGYVLAALSCASEPGFRAALYYGLAYAVMSMAVFAVLAALAGRAGGGGRIAEYRGVAGRHPWLALAFAVGVLSLAGLPPTAGFFAKLFVLSALLQSGHPFLAVVLVLATATSFYYYLRLLLTFFQTEAAQAPAPARTALGTSVVTGASVALTLGVGFWSGFFLGI